MTKKIFTFLALFVMGFLLAAPEARADLTITPWRVVFGPRDRSATIQLLNTTDHENTYRMGWLILKAMPDGAYRMVPATDESKKDPHGVQNMVIFSPRQVTIEGHGEQVIRLSLRRPADLPPGEYRAHLSLTRMAKTETSVQDPNAKSMELALNVNLGFSVPVIVRQGQDKDLKISLSNPGLVPLKNGGSALTIDINRVAGKFSSYGTVDVFWKPPGKSEKKIGTLTNMALYPELKTRHVNVPLTTSDSINGGSIHVVYEGKDESEGTTWAEHTFLIGK
jgi:fimbrial chaperone protein